MLDERFKMKNEADWIAIFKENDVWYTRVRRYEDMLEDPQALLTPSHCNSTVTAL